MASGLDLAEQKMAAAGVNPTARAIFAHYWGQLASGVSGMIAEADVEPVANPASAPSGPPTREDLEALGATAMIRLNGGLGTSMGLDRAKSLLEVRPRETFLDVIVQQVLATRRRFGVPLPLVFLHSFNTQADCLAYLAHYPGLEVDGLGPDMLQSQEPKLDRQTLAPANWPAEPALEWCPPGHGDLYPTLLDSGMLSRLIAVGFRYASVSNSDNLGCAPSPQLAGWFAASGAPYAAEVTPRTPMDLKGGHIVRRRADGRLILRETAQTAPEEMRFFTDATVHPYTHTNNLWLNLEALQTRLTETGGVLGLPLIRNGKNIDPADRTSPEVWQLESAMGAAIEVFDGATVVAVPRDRFLPAKTTNELTLLRSDIYNWGEDQVPRLAVARAPVVTLGPAYAQMGDYQTRLPHGLGLRQARSLRVEGDWVFEQDVQVEGDVVLGAEGGRIPAGTILRG
jgi:UTP--glucose-1-phosphate uridylyltransferase